MFMLLQLLITYICINIFDNLIKIPYLFPILYMVLQLGWQLRVSIRDKEQISQILFLVVKLTTSQLLLSLIVQFRWEVCQLNVSNVFLHESLKEDVFMEQPLITQIMISPHICHLKKSLYGLKAGSQIIVQMSSSPFNFL